MPLSLGNGKRFRIVPILAIAATAIFDRASNPVGVAIVVLSVLFFWEYRFSCKLLGSFLGFLLSTLGIFLYFNCGLFQSSGRFQMYRFTWAAIKVLPVRYWLFGVGNGTYYMMGKQIQTMNNFMPMKGGDWFWLHSDWLQTGFELGILGLAAAYLFGSPGIVSNAPAARQGSFSFGF